MTAKTALALLDNCSGVSIYSGLTKPVDRIVSKYEMRIKLIRSATLLFFHLFLAKFYRHAIADVYLHEPRS